MSKRLLAVMLAALMLISTLAACAEKDKPPVNDNSTTTAGQTTASTSASTPEDTTPEPPPAYQPDPDAKHSGSVGLGVSAGTAYFDDLEVKNLGSQAEINYLIDRADFDESESPAFTALGSTDAVTPTVVADPSDKKAENHAVELSEGTLMCGDPVWNLYRFNVKVMPADENTMIDIYFCVKDKDNYFVLTLGEEGNTQANCYQVKDGVKENAQFAYPLTLETDKLTMVGINVEAEIISINIGGKSAFSLFDPNVINNYCEYNGEEKPGSIEKGGFGAPDVDVDWVRVAEENVLHDGKGTWGGNLANIASKVFDNDNTTYYDCDAKQDTPGASEGELIGIPGDGTFSTGYVGAKLDAATTIRYIRYAMRKDNPARSAGCTIEASVDGTTWVKIADVTETSTANEYHTIKITDETEYQFVRFVAGPDDSQYCNVAELEIWVNA